MLFIEVYFSQVWFDTGLIGWLPGGACWSTGTVKSFTPCRLCQYSTSTFEDSCPGNAGVKRNNRGCRLTGKTTVTSGVRLVRSKVLRSLRHYRLAKSQGHNTKEEKGPSSIRPILELFQRQCCWHFSETGAEHIWVFPSASKPNSNGLWRGTDREANPWGMGRARESNVITVHTVTVLAVVTKSGSREQLCETCCCSWSVKGVASGNSVHKSLIWKERVRKDLLVIYSKLSCLFMYSLLTLFTWLFFLFFCGIIASKYTLQSYYRIIDCCLRSVYNFFPFVIRVVVKYSVVCIV